MVTENPQTIDPNVADEKALRQLPGVGPAMAERIVEARPFSGIEDMARVSGIGPAVLERLKPLLVFSSTESELPLAEPEAIGMGSLPPTEDAEAHLAEEAWAFPEALEMEAVEAKVLPDAVAEEDMADEGEAVPAEALEPEAPARPEPTPVPALRAAPANRGRTLWWVTIGGLFSVILAVALSLGILATLNGGQLQFVSPAQLSALTVRVEGLEAKADDLGQDIDSLRTRLENLEALSGRVSVLEQASEGLRTDVDETATQVKALSDQAGELESGLQDLVQRVDSLEGQVEVVQSQNERVTAFLEGLRDLMDALFGPEGGEP